MICHAACTYTNVQRQQQRNTAKLEIGKVAIATHLGALRAPPSFCAYVTATEGGVDQLACPEEVSQGQ